MAPRPWCARWRRNSPGDRFERGIIAEDQDGLELQLMRGVEDVLDPAGLMNPGKVLPDV